MGVDIPLSYNDDENGTIHYDTFHDIILQHGHKYIKVHRDELDNDKVIDYVTAIVSDETRSHFNKVIGQRCTNYFRLSDYLWDRGRIFVSRIFNHKFEIFLSCE